MTCRPGTTLGELSQTACPLMSVAYEDSTVYALTQLRWTLSKIVSVLGSRLPADIAQSFLSPGYVKGAHIIEPLMQDPAQRNQGPAPMSAMQEAEETRQDSSISSFMEVHLRRLDDALSIRR